MSDQRLIGFTVILPAGQEWTPERPCKPVLDHLEAIAGSYGLELHAIDDQEPREEALSGHTFQILDRALMVPEEWQ
jgi:hypothetical protein